MKAISTKYLSATNTKGARIKAYDCDNNQLTIPYRYELNSDQAYRKAAEGLRDKMGWTGDLIAGATKEGYVFVFDNGLYESLRILTRYAVKGEDRYKATNPYLKPEIKQALKTISNIQGIRDYLDANID